MIKTILVAIAALSVGVALGVAAVHHRVSPQLGAAQAGKDSLEKEKRRLEDESKSLRAQLEAAEAPMARLHKEAARGSIADAAGQDPGLGVLDEADTFVMPDVLTSDAARTADSAAATRNRRVRQDGPAAETSDEGSRFTNRDEMVGRFREGVSAYLGEEIAKSNDPVVEERLSALNEQFQQQMDLTQQVRAAKTDEERQAIRQALAEVRETSRTLVQDQQDYMLRQLAAEYGVTNPDKQDQFIQSMRETQDSPFFRMPGGMPGGLLWGAIGRGRVDGGSGGTRAHN